MSLNITADIRRVIRTTSHLHLQDEAPPRGGVSKVTFVPVSREMKIIKKKRECGELAGVSGGQPLEGDGGF